MKKHFKLYKSGKLWVTAAVAVLSFAVSANLNQASASDNTDVTSTQNEYFSTLSQVGLPTLIVLVLVIPLFFNLNLVIECVQS
ncbi:KxYKxGKxW signal peptide domain-containing protein [Limosilactobacillus portuensis]|uniref:KxYKxGKxW signal peptide domain-containing protein n=1 Tax=Limosilactobacillus portuensis TaxID=2742601 RepID=UPI003D72D19F